MKMNKLTLPISLIIALLIRTDFLFAQSNGSVDGELKIGRPITINFDGPEASETGAYNPFMNYILIVAFRHESGEIVPRCFTADGNASESIATSGNKWRVHFEPDRSEEWTYTASFGMGEDIAVNLSSTVGESVSFDGSSGSINISESDKSGRDHRGKGILRYVGENFLRFENGEWFMKGGANAPETLFTYAGFDGTNLPTVPSTHSYGDEPVWGSTQHKDRRGAFTIKKMKPYPPIRDWNEGGLACKGNKGKGLTGGLNHIAEI